MRFCPQVTHNSKYLAAWARLQTCLPGGADISSIWNKCYEEKMGHFFLQPVRGKKVTLRGAGIKRSYQKKTTRKCPPAKSYPCNSSTFFVTAVLVLWPWCAPCPPVLCLWDRFLHQRCCECLVDTRRKHLPAIHRRHYSGTNQEPGKDNVSWKTTRVLITDTLSHAYWLSPEGMGVKISWICRMERGRERRCNGEWKTFRDIWIQRGCIVVIGDVNKAATRMH